MDVSIIRKRVKSEIEQARRSAAERRERARTTLHAYEQFLADVAVPAFRQMATVLRAEGIPFEVQTPSDGVRLVSDRNRDDIVALELDTTHDPPQVILTSSHTWGSRTVHRERVVHERAPIGEITEDHVFELLFAELRPWLA
jgi:hypothetical protein